jgi:hypothetical protein
MSNILLSKKLLTKMNAIIRDFWWTGIQQDFKTKPIYFKAWSEICKSKKEGGLGIRNLETINKALILTAAWKIVTLPDSNTAKILKAKYFHNTSFWRANPKLPKSAFWTSILKVKNQLEDATTIQFYRGNTSIWSEPWCPFWKDIYNQLKIQDINFKYPTMVSDLWIPNAKQWNIPLLTALFGVQNANIVANIPINKDNGDDMLIWKHTPSGVCTSNSAYQLFNPSLYGLNAGPHQTITTQVRAILQGIWKCDNMPPRVQVFGWRLMRGALATGMRAGARSKNIDPNCIRCGKEENDIHLFFECKFAQAVWFASSLGLRVEGLHYREDAQIHDILHYIITSYKEKDAIQTVFSILWSIWKARNNLLFNKKRCTPLQVLFQAKALQTEKEVALMGKTLKSQNEDGRKTEPNKADDDWHTALKGSKIYVDAAWKGEELPSNDKNHQKEKIGIGIYFDLN